MSDVTSQQPARPATAHPIAVPAPPSPSASAAGARGARGQWRRLAPGLVILALGGVLAVAAWLSVAPVPDFPALTDEPLGLDGQVVFAQEGCVRVADLGSGATRELTCLSGVDALTLVGDDVHVEDYGGGNELSVDLETGYVTTLPPYTTPPATVEDAGEVRVTAEERRLTVQRVGGGAVETVLEVAIPSSYYVYEAVALDGAVVARDSSERLLVVTRDGSVRVVATDVDTLALRGESP